MAARRAEAIAFGGWWQYRGEYGTATWAEPFEKLAQIAEAAGNWLKGRGYQKWDDVFERAYQGEMAERVPRQFADREPQLAVEPRILTTLHAASTKTWMRLPVVTFL